MLEMNSLEGGANNGDQTAERRHRGLQQRPTRFRQSDERHQWGGEQQPPQVLIGQAPPQQQQSTTRAARSITRTTTTNTRTSIRTSIKTSPPQGPVEAPLLRPSTETATSLLLLPKTILARSISRHLPSLRMTRRTR
uniref:Putative topoisomerase 1 n=1 Tax=Ixodes ricinus TaxID=34613 RepID=A0A0K8RAJ5_IXORI